MINILVPIDFSKLALRSLDYACSLAKQMNGKVILFHNVEPVSVEPGRPSQEKKNLYRLDVYAQLNDVIKTLKIEKSRVSTYISQGNVTDELINASEVVNADLIVMSTKGLSRYSEVLLGSKAAEIIERSKVPVLALPPSYYTGKIKKIVFAVDFNESDVELVHKLTKVASVFNAELLVLHISDLNDDESQIAWFREEVLLRNNYPHLNFQCIQAVNVQQTVQEYLGNPDSQMLVMNTRRKSWVEKFLTYGLTKQKAYHIRFPMLAFNNQKELQTIYSV